MKLIHYKEGQYPSQADPFLIRAHDGKFYMYVSAMDSYGIHAFRSDSLCGEYEDIGVVCNVPGCHQYWAPSVIYTGGKYYMYLSFMKAEETDTRYQTMHVLESDSPAGPFVNPIKLAEPFSIDSHVVENEEGLFMFYSINDYEAERAGTYIVVDKMESPTKMCGKPVAVVRATLDEEIYTRNSAVVNGRNWHTIEGAFYFKKGDYHYVIYSGNCYRNEYYYLGYSVAKTTEKDLTKIKFTKYPDENTYAPLIAKNEYEEGTGHNSVIDVDGEFYAIYHGRDIGVSGKGNNDTRTARICRLVIDGEKITAIRKENSL